MDMLDRATTNEMNLWEERVATTDAHGLWHSHDGLLVFPVVSIIVLDVHSLDHCARGEVLRKIKRVLVALPTSPCSSR